MNLRLLSYNIRFGGRRRAHLLTGILRRLQPDLVLFQEATDPRVIEAIARAVDVPLWVARRRWSVALLSRIPDVRWQWHNPAGMRHPFMEVTLPRLEVTLFGLHLSPRFSGWAENRRLRELDFILKAATAPQTARRLHLFTGDFNTVAPTDGIQVHLLPAWIRTLIRLSGGRLPTRVIGRLLAAGYVDGFRKIHGDLDGSTFPAVSPRVRLDYVFLSPELSKHLNHCRVIQAPEEVRHASDHLPLLSEFTF
jgi:exodeoxyribonuclease-3